MSGLWDDWYDQTAMIEPLLGSGGMGEVYGPATPVACQIEQETRLVRNQDAAEVVSTSTLLCPEGTIAPAGSLVLLPGETAKRTVISSGRQHADDPDLTGVEIALT